MTESENAFRNTCRNSIIFCIFALAAALAVFVIFPVSGKNEEDIENLVSPFYNQTLVVKPRNTNYGTGITVFSK